MKILSTIIASLKNYLLNLFMITSIIGTVSFYSSNNAVASHAMGTELTYECLGNNTYEFTLYFYRDCSGITAPTQVTIDISSINCSFASSTVLTVTGPGVDISPLCPSALSTCNGGTNPGVERYEYTGTYTLPQNCSDWVFSFSECCRNGLITNLSAPSSQNLYVESTLDNSTGSCNNSPAFTTLPVPYICAGQNVNYNMGAYDIDGDSLVYTLVDAMGASGTTLLYIPPYTGTYPISTDSGYVNFDPNTGNLSLTPNLTQTCIVTVLVEEYRNGVLIGSIMRDIQVIVLNCPSNTQPLISSPQILNLTGGGVLVDSNSIEVCVGLPVFFDLLGIDADTADTVSLTTNLSTVIPAASFNTTGVNPITGNFAWVPTNNDIGTNSFTVTIEDNACPILGKQTYVYDIRVLQGVYAGPDIYHCTGDSVQLNATGSLNYSWTPSTGLSDTNIANPMAFPNTTTTYVVTGDSTAGCKYVDTVIVNIVSDFTLTMGADQNICLTDSAQLEVIASPAGTYTYSWTPTNGLDDPNSSTPMASPASNTTYQVEVVAANGCNHNSSVNVNVSTFPLSVNPTTDTNLVCSGDTANLNANVYASDCSDYSTGTITFSPVSGTGTSVILGDDQVSTALPIGFNFNFFCNDYTSFYIGSNGFITFTSTLSSGCCTGQLLPNAVDPNNVIAFAWDDLNPSLGGTIEYFTTGSAPNRQLVMNFINVPHYGGTNNVTSQVVLHEGTNYIDIHTTSMITDGSNHTMGIENIDGTYGVAYPGRNSNPSWSATNEGVRFEQLSLSSYTVSWYNNGNLIGNTEDLAVFPDTLSTYTVVVIDQTSGCIVSDSLTIAASPTINLVTQSQDASCGSADGEASVLASGGIAPYTYLWSDSLGSTTDTIMNLDAGTYTIIVSDSNGCSSSSTVSVNNAGAATINVSSITNVSCYGGTDGSATISATGGTGAYTYIWDDPGMQTTATANGLDMGSYSVTVTDSLGCSSSTTINITEPIELGVVITKNDALCGLPNGDATAQGLGGTAPYTYLWSDTAAQTTATAYNLSPGIYDVIITDSLGCSSTGTINVLGINAPIASIASSNNVTYYGGSDGNATVSATGGTPPYNYVWSDPMSQTNAMANGLAAGSYSVTVTDADTCISVVSVVISQPSSIDVSVVSFDSIGTNCTEVITVTVLNYGDTLLAGDSIAISYSVDSITVNEYLVLSSDLYPGGNIIYSFSTTANLYAYGTYNILSWTDLTGDGNNSNDTIATIVTSSFPLSMSPDADTNIVCFGESTVIHANVNSSDCNTYNTQNIGFAPITGTGTPVTLSDDQLSGALPIGFNFNFFCNDYSNFHISSNGYITFTAGVNSGCCSGQVLPDNFDPNNLIAFAWNDLDPGSGGTIEYFTKGTAPNRTLSINFNSVPHFGGASPVTTQIILHETSNMIDIHTTSMPITGGFHTMGIENIDGTNGVAYPGRNGTSTWSATNEGVRFAPLQVMGYTVEWIDGNGTTIDTVQDVTVSPDSATTYTVITTDLSNGCTIIDSVTISASPEIISSTTSQNATCGSNDGIGIITVSGGNPPYAYLWDDPLNQTNDTATGLGLGIYNVLITDGNGCNDSGMVTISNIGAPSLGNPTITNVSCYGGNDGTATISPTGGTSPYAYLWNDNSGQTNATATGLSAGTYMVTVSGGDSCSSTGIVIITEPTALSLTTVSSSASCGANDGTVSVGASGGTTPYAYLWDDQLAQSTDTAYNLPAGVYNVVVTDSNGCSATMSATVSNPSAPTATLDTVINASCNGSQDGSASIIVSGGTSPYTYSWDDPMNQTTATATGLPAGSYVATVTDANNCVVSVPVTVTEPPAINLPYIENFDSNTPINSGSPGAPVISLNNGWENDQNDQQDWAPRSNGTQSGNTGPVSDHTSGTGNYVYVEDGFDNDSVSLISPCMNISTLCGATLSFWYHSFNGTDTTQKSTLSVDIHANGMWNLNVTNPISIDINDWKQATVDLTSFTDAIKIRFRVNNNNGTPYHDIAIDDVEVFGQNSFTNTITETNASCNGICDGEATISSSGGSAPYAYSWDDPTTQTTATATGLCAGSYSVTITDSSGCGMVEQITITEPSALVSTSTVVNATVGNADGSASLTVTGGAAPYNYLWDDPAAQTTATATGLIAGSYSCVVTDANGCTVSVSVTIGEYTLINTYGDNAKFNIFPNPTDGKFTLDIDLIDESEYFISIRNVLGKSIVEFSTESPSLLKEINMESFGNGTYFIQLISSKGVITKQLILTK